MHNAQHTYTDTHRIQPRYASPIKCETCTENPTKIAKKKRSSTQHMFLFLVLFLSRFRSSFTCMKTKTHTLERCTLHTVFVFLKISFDDLMSCAENAREKILMEIVVARKKNAPKKMWPCSAAHFHLVLSQNMVFATLKESFRFRKPNKLLIGIAKIFDNLPN